MPTIRESREIRSFRTSRNSNDEQAVISSWLTGRPWSDAEEEELLDLVSEQSIANVATVLDRSEAAIRKKLRQLRERDDVLGGFKAKDLAALLNVTVRQIRRWRSKGYLHGINGRITEESFSQFCKKHPDKIPFESLDGDAKLWLASFGFRQDTPHLNKTLGGKNDL